MVDNVRYISEHLSARENRCRCGECRLFGADVELVRAVEVIRATARAQLKEDAIILVHSWFRCRAHNNRPNTERGPFGILGAGSNDNSFHLTGAAIDFNIPEVEPVRVYSLIRRLYPDRYGLGLYDWGVHLDVRPEKAFWDERSVVA